MIAARSESCLAVTRTMSDSLERPLTLRERYAVRLHSLICVACVNYLRQIKFMKTESRAVQADLDVHSIGLTGSARSRISDSLREGE